VGSGRKRINDWELPYNPRPATRDPSYCPLPTPERITMTGDDLRSIPLFAALGDDDLDWISEAGRELRLATGDRLFAEGETDVAFFVLLDGRLQVTKRVGAEETVLATHEPGAFTGEVPLLTGTPYIATVRAVAPSRLLRVEAAPFQRMLARCPGVAETVLRAVAQRLQLVGATLQQQEKLAALGKMAAGLAHELNNPAAAARRAADLLTEAVAGVERLALDLGRAGLDPAALAALTDLRRGAIAAGGAAPVLSPLERSDQEDDLAAWLDERGVADPWDLAPVLVGAGLPRERLAALGERLPAAAWGTAVAWLGASLAAAGLVGEVARGTARVSELVAAVKRYSYLDQAPAQAVDLVEGLESTLTMLGHALTGIDVVRDYDPALPRIPAFGGELNQVWTNLIDNAVAAMAGRGRLTVRAAREAERVLVEIGDDGPGIPPEVLPRIFEPFFTTKPVGEGTGLGLDISRRIVVGRHRGDLRVESRPGATRFQIWLPLGPVSSEQAPP
jgi:signal transduction histidine kinase